MDFWFERSKKERGTAYVAAEQGGTAVFGTVHIGTREVVHAASILAAAAALRGLTKRKKRTARTQKRILCAQNAALRRTQNVGKLYNKKRG